MGYPRMTNVDRWGKVPKVREVELMSCKQTKKVKNLAKIVADHMTTAVMSASLHLSKRLTN